MSGSAHPPIAVFYHCVLSGPRIPSEAYAISLFQSQMNALGSSGLLREAKEFHIGINGNDGEALLASAFCDAGAQFHIHPQGQSELSTLSDLQQWLRPGWFVLYHHIKGVQHVNDRACEQWRKGMEHHCVYEWDQCVKWLESGYDAVGCHWLTPQKYSGLVVNPLFGGNFWWAKSDFLMKLPPVATDTWDNRYWAEGWVGQGNPKVMDLHPGWPMR